MQSVSSGVQFCINGGEIFQVEIFDELGGEIFYSEIIPSWFIAYCIVTDYYPNLKYKYIIALSNAPDV